ncbi:hypothetical protein OBBRIDRAFT_792613 [Obba rivulosa]|uniref:Secreted protein n=1 Tax=Obba rivulosa TaxID=1052685 RepID=A0A8E2AV13_9APHY|nr:hypothetical protein OBBRIDRAFT_792613 [Obba rivulosa]
MLSRLYAALAITIAVCLLATPTFASPVDASLPIVSGSHAHGGIAINYPRSETSAAWKLAHLKQSVPVSRPAANSDS